MSVSAGGDHDDGDIAYPTNRWTDVEPVDTGKHDVDKDHVARLTGECLQCLFASVGFFDLPTLVFKGEANGGADSFIVLDGQDASSHRPTIVTDGRALRQVFSFDPD